MELEKLREKLTVLRGLENELHHIRRRIDSEQNPVKKAKMLNVYDRMSKDLIGKEM
jgi:hypothetical protein